MLDPEYLERAGDLVGAVYSEIEAEMCDHLVLAMLAGDVSDWRSQVALQLLAQGQAPQLRMVLERHRNEINAAVRKEVEQALARSDAHDLAQIKRALGVDLPKVSTQQVAQVVRTIAEMLERDNVDLMNGARDAFLRESTWAVTQVGTGMLSPDEAMREATRRLARDGLEVVQYRDPTTGDKTVRNRVDVAVRRHVRSQLNQACNTRTMQVCRETGCDFVEVSSHYGARPSHQDWEGRCYHVGGPATVDGVTYEDFGEATGYYGEGPHGALGDRLCGVNCRHSFGPWFPGMPRAYHPEPKHPSGKTNKEIYELTQKQRRMERNIRDTKRELAAAERAYEADPSLKNQTAANQIKQRLAKQQQALADLVKENDDVLTRQSNREWAGDMPRVRVPEASGRTMQDFIDTPAVEKARAGAGVSKAALSKAMRDELSTDGMSGKHFAKLSARDQQSLLRRALARIKAQAKPATKPKHLSPWKKTTETGVDQCVAATNPRFRPNDAEWGHNCQRCVGAYELRRRGYDVTARPRILDANGRPSNSDRLAYMRDAEGWPHMFESPDLISCSSNTGANTGRKVEQLMSSWGDGARAIVRVQWRRGGGHVFIAEQVGGQTRFVDPQTGSLDCSGYFARAKRNATYCMRIDDRKYTDLINKAAEEA